MFHDTDPGYSLVECLEDEIQNAPHVTDPAPGRLENTGMRIRQATDGPVGAFGSADLAVAGKARTVSGETMARVRSLTGSAASQMGASCRPDLSNDLPGLGKMPCQSQQLI